MHTNLHVQKPIPTGGQRARAHTHTHGKRGKDLREGKREEIQIGGNMQKRVKTRLEKHFSPVEPPF